METPKGFLRNADGDPCSLCRLLSRSRIMNTPSMRNVSAIRAPMTTSVLVDSSFSLRAETDQTFVKTYSRELTKIFQYFDSPPTEVRSIGISSSTKNKYLGNCKLVNSFKV